MATKVKPGEMKVIESRDGQRVTVSVDFFVGSITSGNSDAFYYVYPAPILHAQEPFLCGEDYPALVHVWDNKDDDIFDNL